MGAAVDPHPHVQVAYWIVSPLVQTFPSSHGCHAVAQQYCDSVALPEHADHPQLGTGFVQVLDRVCEVPEQLPHEPNAVHHPLIALFTREQYAEDVPGLLHFGVLHESHPLHHPSL